MVNRLSAKRLANSGGGRKPKGVHTSLAFVISFAAVALVLPSLRLQIISKNILYLVPANPFERV